MKKLLIGVVLVFGLLCTGLVIAIGMTGLVPGLSDLLGSTKPRDLGVEFTETEAKVAYGKNGVEGNSLPSDTPITESLRYEGKKQVTFSMSSSEITAMLAKNGYVYSPASQVQLRINSDGTGEASGVLHVDRILPYISLSHPTGEIEQAMEKYHVSGTPAFYLKGNVEVVNNQVTLRPSAVEIGRIRIPPELVSKNVPFAVQYIEDRIAKVPGLSVDSLKLDNGNVVFAGTVPEKEFAVREVAR